MFLNAKRKVNLNGVILLFSTFFCAVFATIQLNPITTRENNNPVPCNTHGSRAAVINGGDTKLSIEQRFMRPRPPNAYCVRIEACSELLTTSPSVEKYETRPFSVGGFNWYKIKIKLLIMHIFNSTFCNVFFLYGRSFIGLLSSNRPGTRLI